MQLRAPCLLPLLIVILAAPGPGSAQSLQPGATPSPTATGTDPSKEAVILESGVTRVVFEPDGSSVRELTSVIRVQAEAGVKAFAVLTFPYTTGNQVIDVDYVRVRKPDGTVIVTPPLNILDMPADVTRVAPMYSDLHEKHVTVKALGVGDVLEYRIRVRTIKPEVRGQFWFEYTFVRNAVCNDEELEISVPKNTPVKVSSPEVQPQTRDEGRRRIYTWKTINREGKTADKPRSPGEGPPPSVQVTTFRSWEEVGRWYGELQKPEVAVTPAIRAKVTELTAGLTSDEEKIRALYAFVSTKIHYVSLSFGIGRFQPHAADDVLGNEYGDCKDKHTLLAAMLKAAGYEAWPALINSSRTIDPDVPSPGQFDHVITVVRLGGGLTWLDTTPEVAPFGLLFTTLRDKEALVIPESGPPALMCTPTLPPFPLFSVVCVTARLSGDGILTARFERTDRSDFEMLLRAAFRSVPRNQWQDLVQQISYGSGFSGTATNVEASSPDDTSWPFRFSYDYSRRDYGDWPNRQIILPLPPFGLPLPSTEGGKPAEPIELGPPGEIVYRATLELPLGYRMTLPKAVDLKRDYAEYHASYSLKDHVLVGERRLAVTSSEVALSQVDDYRAFEKAVRDDYGTWLTLVSATSSNTAAVPGSLDAKGWFDKATAELDANNWVAAQNAFLQALRIDPSYRRAHLGLGRAYVALNRIGPGLDELRREMDLHPEDPAGYKPLAEILAHLHRDDEAIEVWRRVLKVDDMDADAATGLGRLLVKAKRYSEAVAVLEAATSLSPENPGLQTLLGYAYLGEKQLQKGSAALTKAVELDPSPDKLNDIASWMGEHDMVVEQAVDLAARAVANAEADSLTISLSGLRLDDLTRTRTLASYWDTLGLVCLRTGAVEKAARYLHAAWALSQRATVGDHLAQLYEREGRKKDAARMYELAFAADTPEGEADIAARYRHLTGRTLKAAPNSGPAGHSSGAPPTSPAEELSRMRRFSVGRTATKVATAEFFLLLTQGAEIAEVRFISGSEALRDAGKLLAALPLAAEFPDNGPVKLLRRGVLSCSPAGCNLALLSPDSVYSLD